MNIWIQNNIANEAKTLIWVSVETSAGERHTPRRHSNIFTEQKQQLTAPGFEYF